MNREIKFRAWNSDDLKMECPLVFAFCMDGNFKPLIKCADDNMAYKDYPIMQFTGLTDKNGKEIYEGDIVKWENDVSEGYKRVKSGKGVIKWNKDYCMFDVSFMTNIQATQYFMIDIISTLKIIGNIYENPELL